MKGHPQILWRGNALNFTAGRSFFGHIPGGTAEGRERNPQEGQVFQHKYGLHI